jgi:ferritin
MEDFSEAFLALLNNQIYVELAASKIYLLASIWFEKRLLSGFSAHFRKQSVRCE